MAATSSPLQATEPVVASPPADRRAGRRLALANLVIATVLIAIRLVQASSDEETVDVIGICAKVSMLYFVVAFTARPLNDWFGARWTSWLQANRRYLGLSFAAWHLQHVVILGTFVARYGADEWMEWFGGMLLTAGSILVFIGVLAATSTDRAQRWLGMRIWSTLHTVGAYTVWGWAVHIYVMRIPENADKHDYVYLGILLAALAVRWSAAAKRLVLLARRRAGTASRGDTASRAA